MRIQCGSGVYRYMSVIFSRARSVFRAVSLRFVRCGGGAMEQWVFADEMTGPVWCDRHPTVDRQRHATGRSVVLAQLP